MHSTDSWLYRVAGEAVSLIFRGSQDGEAYLSPPAWQVIGGTLADFNLALIASSPDTETYLRAFTERLQTRKLPGIVLITPAVTEQLAPVCQSLGFQRGGQMPLMLRAAAPVLPASSPYRYTSVENLHDLHTAYDLMARAFELPLAPFSESMGERLLDAPGIHLFLAWHEKVPISTVVIAQAGSIAGVWCMATPPDYQRRGAGRGLLEYSLAYYQDRGVESVYLLATAAGQPLYEHLGFHTIAALDVWVEGHSTQAMGH